MDIHQPMEWTTTPLGEVTGFQNGYAFKSSTYRDDGAFVIRIGNVQAHGISLNNPAYVDPVVLGAENFLLCEGDMLISLTGNVGRVAVIRQEHLPAVLNQRVARVQPAGSVEKGFLFHLMRSEQVQRKTFESAKGAAQLNISTKDLARIEVPLPPLAEQKVIAEKLDTLLAQVENTKARLERIPQILKRFRQSVLAAAVSGRLTEEWREPEQGIETTEKLSVPNCWNTVQLGELSEFITSGSRGWARYYSDAGSLFIRSQDINTDELQLSNPCYVRLPNNAEGKRTKVQKNDLLLTITGANVTKCARVKTDFDDAYVSQHVSLIRLADPSMAPFVELVLKAPNAGRYQLQKAAYGGGKPGLSLQNIRDVKLALPEHEEKAADIVRHVNRHLAHADRIEQQVQAALERVNHLTQSILAKAFRGELTEQWRKDNPELISGENSAEALLERIKAERAAMKPAKRTRKTKAHV